VTAPRDATLATLLAAALGAEKAGDLMAAVHIPVPLLDEAGNPASRARPWRWFCFTTLLIGCPRAATMSPASEKRAAR
jgi:hypothetical protein